MRLPLPIRPKSRYPQDEARVPLKVMRPIKLRDHVSGKGEKSGQVACLQEMTIMMACFKLNEFNEANCSKEIEHFQSCVVDNLKAIREREAQIKKGATVGAKKLSHLQVNQILQKYPLS